MTNVNITGIAALPDSLASPFTRFLAQMAARDHVQSLFDQFYATCKTVQRQEAAGAGVAAWQLVVADMRAKLPDIAAQGKVTPSCALC